MIVIIILIIIAIIFAVSGYWVWRRILRFAKGVERGLKMVPVLIHLPPSSEDIEVGGRDVRDVMTERISQAEVLYNLIASTAQKGFKSKVYGQRHIAFEIIARGGMIRYYAAIPMPLLSVIKQAVLTAYPTASLEEVEEHNLFNPAGKITGTIGGEIVLKEDYAYPIATFNELKRDSMTALVNALSSLSAEDGAGIQILLRPAPDKWASRGTSLAEKKRKQGSGGGNKLNWRELLKAPIRTPEQKEDKPEDKQLSTTEQSVVEAIEEKTKHPGYEVLIRVVASSNTATRSQTVLHNLISTFSLFDAPGRNGFRYSETNDIQNFVTAFIFRFFPPKENKMILNSIELATLFHLPDEQFTYTSQIQRQATKQVEGPSKVVAEGVLMGYNVFRGVRREIRLSQEDRRRHTYIVGQTGTGKSTMIENMAAQDMLAGRGFAFIDPHGDAAESLLTLVPKERAEDVIYFNPGDMTNPMGLNLFEFQMPEQKDFLIQETINMLYKLYDPQHQGIIGPRYEHWFRNAALTIMSDPAGTTFIDLPKVFIDRQFQREKMQYVTDPTVKDFWNKEMAQTSDYHKSEILGWFVSKFGAFASNEMMRNIIGQVKSSFDLREVMDNNKILIVNLSKGKTGELNSMLLGMIFVMKFQAAAMSRASVPESQRPDFSLYVDEFQNFSTDSFATILSEARKYHLNLVVANQYIGQLTEEIRDSVFGNVGTITSFRASPADADFMVKQFEPTFDTQDIVKLPNFQAIVRLMISGLPSQPFNMESLPPIQVTNPQLAIALKQLSAAKYGRPRARVEKEIFKRLETKAPSLSSRPGFPPQAAARPQRPSSGSSFLDEWLAKRRSQQSGGGASRPTGGIGSPQSQPARPPAPSASAQPTPPGSQPAQAQRTDSQPPREPAKTTPPPSAQPRPPDTTPTRPEKAEPADQSDTAAKAQPSPSDHPPAPAEKDRQDQPASDAQASRPPASRQETSSPPLADDKSQPPRQLKPGEVFIDEAGNIHRG